ncbi:hypothetical protein BCR33DRAFT_710924 [Rhizoclosmatium globosum]|uniref:Uncharacterized protein n=1 Tax=Rhizoclosmatium globosum TaxID=329046 RepID=A0A1Y2D2J9_9FUNG|nr:hypothetical protein BCR33DRAFT_710924 [Rhizoclosmatium globosum]|eukprot:ORY53512.1 hypothetical protein BCR33DRAFT_710924 [Rhizoclosmatium globosum]
MSLASVLVLTLITTFSCADLLNESPFGPQTLPLLTATQNQTGGFSGIQMFNYNGPILSSVEIYPIFYGAKTTYVPNLLKFYKGVVNSSYFDWLSEYNTSRQSLTRGSLAGSYWDNSTTSTQLQDSDLHTYLVSLIQRKLIPIPTENTYFPIHLAPNIDIVANGIRLSCESWCAYHSTINITHLGIPNVTALVYSVIPDQGGTCFGGCGADPNVFNNLCSVSSHELVESVTDPNVGLGQLTWYGANGEVSDLCNHIHGEITTLEGVFVVQKTYSNQKGMCIVDVPGTPVHLPPRSAGGYGTVTKTTTKTTKRTTTTTKKTKTTTKKRTTSTTTKRKTTVTKKAVSKTTTTSKHKVTSTTTHSKTATKTPLKNAATLPTMAF